MGRSLEGLALVHEGLIDEGMRRWNWWLPRRPARILRVEPSAAQLEVKPVPQAA